MNTAKESISERQTELLVAAGKILSCSGVQALTTKNLAKEMNFSESAIYRHFKSKEDIVIALLSYLANNMEKRYQEIQEKNLAPKKHLVALFSNQFMFFKEHPHFVVAIFSEGLIDGNKRLLEAIKNIMSVTMRFVLPILKKGQQTGAFRDDLEAEDLIQIVMGTFRLQMFKWRMENFTYDIEKKGKKTINNLLKILEK